MKITKQQLKQIIKEELAQVLDEQDVEPTEADDIDIPEVEPAEGTQTLTGPSGNPISPESSLGKELESQGITTTQEFSNRLGGPDISGEIEAIKTKSINKAVRASAYEKRMGFDAGSDQHKAYTKDVMVSSGTDQGTPEEVAVAKARLAAYREDKSSGYNP
jgi:hypothetical protein